MTAKNAKRSPQHPTRFYTTTAAFLGFALGEILLFASPLWAAQAFQESAGQVVMEAENYDAKIPRNGKDWALQVAKSGYSGSGYLISLPNSGAGINTNYVTGSPEVVYNVNFTTTGTYYLWTRGQGDTGNDDSSHAGVDGAGPATADRLSGFYTTAWVWKRDTMDSAPATLAITTPGLHTIHIWMREDGMKVDKLLLRTSSSSTAPSGTGPAQSARITVSSDTTPPAVNLTSPPNAALLRQTVTVSANASDNVGVTGVQFKLDGANLGSEDTTSPYSISWNTTTASGGPHTLTAVARDAAGLSTTAAVVNVTVDNAAPSLSAITAGSIGTTTAAVSWTTNETSTSQVEYGLTTGYGQLTSLNSALVTSHSAALSALSPATLYHYRVRSTDAAGNETVSADQTFTTLPATTVQVFQESAGQVVMEAERYDAKIARNSQNWQLATAASGYSGSGYMEAVPNTGANINAGYTTTSPELVFNTTFTTTGTYYVWVRGSGVSGNDDSIHAGLDGAGPSSADRMDGYNSAAWVWKRQTLDGVAPTLAITTPGLHTIHIWMREDGTRVDKLLLRTSSSATAPSGTGPSESPRVAVPVTDGPPVITAVTLQPAATLYPGQTLTISATVTDLDPSPLEYQFMIDGVVVQPWSAASSHIRTIAAADFGKHRIEVQVRDAGGQTQLQRNCHVYQQPLTPP